MIEKEPFVSIVICTHNRKESLEKYAFKSLIELDYSNYEVIIIDDASTDGTIELVEGYKNKIKNLRYVKNQKMQGLCYVRNLGVKHSKGNIITFTDDDCYVDKNWLNELVKPYLEKKETMVVGGKSYISNTKKLYNQNNEIYGCNMSFRREIFNKFLFDKKIYFNKSSFHDEKDLILRIKNKNFKIFFAEKAKVKHFIMPSKYRKNAAIGKCLNFIYIEAKKLPLLQYYNILINNIAKGLSKKHQYNPKYKSLNGGLGPLRDKILKNNLYKKIPYIFYVLLFEIPIKARIQHILEEKRFKNNNNNRK